MNCDYDEYEERDTGNTYSEDEIIDDYIRRDTGNDSLIKSSSTYSKLLDRYNDLEEDYEELINDCEKLEDHVKNKDKAYNKLFKELKDTVNVPYGTKIDFKKLRNLINKNKEYIDAYMNSKPEPEITKKPEIKTRVKLNGTTYLVDKHGNMEIDEPHNGVSYTFDGILGHVQNILKKLNK